MFGGLTLARCLLKGGRKLCRHGMEDVATWFCVEARPGVINGTFLCKGISAQTYYRLELTGDVSGCKAGLLPGELGTARSPGRPAAPAPGSEV